MPKVSADEVHRRLDSESHVGLVEIRLPPNNYLTVFNVRAIAAAMEELDSEPDCRCIVLASQGKHFCAGRDFGTQRAPEDTSAAVYQEAVRLVRLETPWVAAVQGAAVGAGLGLALVADFRICSQRAYFSANFVKLGLHHGFGLTVTLPLVVGWQAATNILYTGRRVGAAEALTIGLVERIAEEDDLRPQALAFAGMIASNPPAAAQAIRRTMRADLASRFASATAHESTEQQALRRDLTS
jgi:enoyl-CoA hydratase/carnithine racemase